MRFSEAKETKIITKLKKNGKETYQKSVRK
jgi:hypothetical protein